MKQSILLARFTQSRTRIWQPRVFAEHLRSISCCRKSAYTRVRFWRHVRIGSILSRWFCNSKRNRIQLGSD